MVAGAADAGLADPARVVSCWPVAIRRFRRSGTIDHLTRSGNGSNAVGSCSVPEKHRHESPYPDLCPQQVSPRPGPRLLDRPLHCAHVLNAGLEGEHQDPHRLTSGGGEVELTGLGRLSVIVGLQVSINCRFLTCLQREP